MDCNLTADGNECRPYVPNVGKGWEDVLVKISLIRSQTYKGKDWIRYTIYEKYSMAMF